MMKKLTVALILSATFVWSGALAQTQEPEHKHQQHQEEKDAPAKKGVSMKDEMKQKMKEKMKDMQCCAKDEQKKPKS
jgi:hypothetical protein